MNISRKYLIAITAALGLIPVVLDTTIVNIALVPISNALHTDLNTAQWIFTAYLLASAVTLAAGGYLGNLFGVKRLFLLGIALFTVSSMLCGLANSIELLIVLRVLQGMGGGLLIPLGQAIAFDQFAPEERARASGIVGVPILLAPIFGPIVGGLMLDNLGWSSIFFINLPIGVLVVWLGLRVLPANKARAGERARFDWLGLALLAMGVSAVLYGVKLVTQTDPSTVTALNPRGDIYGWGNWLVWVWLGGGLALLAGFALYSLFVSKDPVLNLRLFRYRDFGTASLVNMAVAVITFGTVLLVPVFLEQIRLPHLSALETAITQLPLGIGSMVGLILGSQLYNIVGAKALAITGITLGGVAAWQLSNLTPTSGGPEMWPWLALIGLGLALTGLPLQTLAMQRLTGPTLPKATSLYTSSRLVTASVGAAALTTIFVEQTTYHAQALAAAALSSLPAGAIPDLSNPAQQAAAQLLVAQAGTMALNDVFVYLSAGSLLVLLLTLALPGRRRVAAESGEPGEASESSVPGFAA